LLARRKTRGCHQQFADHVPESHQIWHSLRGSSTEDFMLCYLDCSRAELHHAQLPDDRPVGHV
jgi:hypothetical protein